jgi:hypothetical protein
MMIRPGSRRDAARTIIGKLFLAQIRTGHTRHLKIALLDLALLEKQHCLVCLSVIMTICMDDIENM